MANIQIIGPHYTNIVLAAGRGTWLTWGPYLFGIPGSTISVTAVRNMESPQAVMTASDISVTTKIRIVAGGIGIPEHYFGANFFNNGPVAVSNWQVVASLISRDQSIEAAKLEEPEASTRLTVIHDRQGNVDSLMTSPPGSPPLQVELRVGQYATEVDAPEVMTVDLDPTAVYGHLAEIVEHYRVDVGSIGGAFTRTTTE